jgi:hypothetical protein
MNSCTIVTSVWDQACSEGKRRASIAYFDELKHGLLACGSDVRHVHGSAEVEDEVKVANHALFDDAAHSAALRQRFVGEALLLGALFGDEVGFQFALFILFDGLPTS